jgi:hypothetical protein
VTPPAAIAPLAPALADLPPDAVAELADWLDDAPCAPVLPPLEADERAELLARAEAAHAEPAPRPDPVLYGEYFRSGDRARYQSVFFRGLTRLGLFCEAAALAPADPRHLDALAAEIEPWLEQPSWVLPAHLANTDRPGGAGYVDLASAFTGGLFAAIVAWHGPRLPADLAARLRRAVLARVIEPCLEDLRDPARPNRNDWMRTRTNWNAVCHAGLLAAGLALLPSREDRALLAAAARANLGHFLDGFTPDGYCSEGIAYWNFGFGHFCLAAEHLLAATRGRLDLYADRRVPAIASFAARVALAPGCYPAFSDCDHRSRPAPWLLQLAARRAGHPSPVPPAEARRFDSAWSTLVSPLHHALHRRQLADCLDAAPAAPAPLSARDVFPDAGVHLWRASSPLKEASPALAVAIKGGHNDEFHNHNDLGAFVVAVDGEPLLLDPGAEIYTARTFSPRRYESRLINSWGHPVPRVGGQLQSAGSRFRARVVHSEHGPERELLVLDLTDAYEVLGLRRLLRRFEFDRATGILRVIDEFSADRPLTFEAALVSYAPLATIAEGALLVGDPASVARLVARASLPFAAPEPISEDAHCGRQARRIAYALPAPAARGSLTLEIVAPAFLSP